MRSQGQAFRVELKAKASQILIAAICVGSLVSPAFADTPTRAEPDPTPEAALAKTKKILEPEKTGDAELDRTLTEWHEFATGWVEKIIQNIRALKDRSKASEPAVVQKPELEKKKK